MEDSNFSSLLALANSHLSKTELPKKGKQLKSPTNSIITGSTSETIITPLKPKQASSIPNLLTSTSSITDVLSRQISNMLIRKEEELKKEKEELKKQEEKNKLTEKMQDLTMEDQDDYVVDLMKAIQTPYVYEPPPPPVQELNNSSSLESLFKQNFEENIERPKTPPEILPCTTDISYILKQKIFKGKCSAFGKVLRSRIRQVAAPYIFERYNTTVKPFDFKTKSPCDLILEERSRPSRYNPYDDIMKRIMGDYDKKETK